MCTQKFHSYTTPAIVEPIGRNFLTGRFPEIVIPSILASIESGAGVRVIDMIASISPKQARYVPDHMSFGSK